MENLVTQIIQSVIVSLVGIIVPILIGWGLKFLNSYLQSKTKNEKLIHAFTIAENIVQTVVNETTQTFVDTLKSTQQWDQDTAKQAFAQAKAQALQLISSETQQIIADETGNFEAWLNSKIESSVKQSKPVTTAVAPPAAPAA